MADTTDTVSDPSVLPESERLAKLEETVTVLTARLDAIERPGWVNNNG